MNKNNILSLLTTLNISKQSASLLLFLIENGSTNVSTIAKRNLLSRTTTYLYLDELECAGLCKQGELSQKYEAVPIHTIQHKLEESLHCAKEKLDEVLNHAIHKEEVPTITIAHNESSANDVYKDLALTLPKGGTYFRYTSRKSEFSRDSFYREARVKKDFERLVITSAEKANNKKHDSNRFIKTVPKDFPFDDDVSLVIYGNKIAHLDHKTGTAITITSKTLARFQEKIFKLLWRKL